MSLAGKRIFITGGSRGIGLAIALRAARDGASIAIAAKTSDPNPKLPGTIHTAAAEIEAAGGKALAIQCDLRDENQIEAAMAQAAEAFGGIDILVNNAGVNLPGVFHEVTNETIDRTLNVNVKGAMYLTRATLPHMLKNKRGSIVNMSSVNGLVSEPYLSVYSASKGALVMFTRGIALDYAKTGIRCNAICPGWVDTPINHAHAKMLGGLDHVYKTIDSFQPIGRPGTSREIANVVLFLASDESSFMTGSIVSADGGMTAQ